MRLEERAAPRREGWEVGVGGGGVIVEEEEETRPSSVINEAERQRDVF